jgi:DNA-binding NarL/FixJ family response regulator
LDRRKPITVVVSRFDDLLQGGLRELLGRDESIEIVAAGVEAQRLSVTLAGHRPDVAILDAGSLKRLSEVRELTVGHPRTKLVLLAHDPTAAVCAQVLAFGASACLDMGTQSRDVLTAIHLASRGMRLTPDAPGSDHAGSGGSYRLLTPKETEVLPLLRAGHSNAQIALSLQVGVETVRTHTRNIYKKLGVSSRRELLAHARPTAEEPPEALPKSRRRLHGPSRGVRTRGHGSLPH